MSLLKINDIEVRYGAIRTIKGVSFHIDKGEIVALLKANGTGKTTTQKTISRMMRPSLSEIRYDNERIDGLPAHDLIHLGICHVPEGHRVFPLMSMTENLEMDAFRFKKPDEEILAQYYEYFPRLLKRKSQFANTLSNSEQQMLTIAQTLINKPRLLLLNEPSMSLTPLIVRQIFDIMRKINASGMTMLIMEQNAAQALALADQNYVLKTNELMLSKTRKDLLTDDRIRAAYLSKEINA